jgi:hypothetical protein
LLDRLAAEHGALPWAALHPRLAEESWADQALQLVDGEDPEIEPTLDDLRTSIAQSRARTVAAEAMRVLGRR